MLLSLAQHSQQKRQPVKMGVFLTLEMLGGAKPTIDDLKRELGTLRRSEIIRMIATVTARVTAPRGQDESLQTKLAEELLSAEHLAGMRRWLQENPDWNWVIFHRRQMGFLWQTAVSTCSEETSDPDSQLAGRTFGRACLMANSLIHEAEPQQTSEKWGSDFHACFVASTIGILDHTPLREIQARAHMLWFQLPKLPEIAKRFRQCGVSDFCSTFQAKYRFSLDSLFSIVLGLWASYLNQVHQNGSPLWLEREFLDGQYRQADVSRALELLSQPPDLLTKDVTEKPWQDWVIDSSLLMAKPILEVVPGKFACPDIGILLRFVTERLYILLRAAYSDDLFPQLFGYVYEEYVNTFIREFGIESDTFRTFWPSPKFQGTTDQVCDGLLYNRHVLQNQDVALLMEYKHRILMPREKYAGDLELTWRGIEDIVGRRDAWMKNKKKGIYQLARNIGRLIKGESAVTGLCRFALTANTRILPALVTYEDSLTLNSVRRWADDRMREALDDEGVDPERVGPLLILSTHDIERIEALHRKTDWATIVNCFADFLVEHKDDPMATFDIYSVKNDLPSEDPQTSLLSRIFAESLDHAAQHVAAPSQIKSTGPAVSK